MHVNKHTDTHLQTLASSNGLEFRGREKRQMSTDKLPSPVTQRLRQPGGKIWASYGSRVERCRDLRVCLLGVGWFWVCSCPLPPPLPAAHLGNEARSLQYGPGLAVPAPWQPLRSPAATWSTHWQCLLIRRSSFLCAGRRRVQLRSSPLQREQRREGSDEVMQRRGPANICLTVLQGWSDVWARCINMAVAPCKFFSCYHLPTTVSNTCGEHHGVINSFSIIKQLDFFSAFQYFVGQAAFK